VKVSVWGKSKGNATGCLGSNSTWIDEKGHQNNHHEEGRRQNGHGKEASPRSSGSGGIYCCDFRLEQELVWTPTMLLWEGRSEWVLFICLRQVFAPSGLGVRFTRCQRIRWKLGLCCKYGRRIDHFHYSIRFVLHLPLIEIVGQGPFFRPRAILQLPA
jgi:hypothetical protein